MFWYYLSDALAVAGFLLQLAVRSRSFAVVLVEDLFGKSVPHSRKLELKEQIRAHVNIDVITGSIASSSLVSLAGVFSLAAADRRLVEEALALGGGWIVITFLAGLLGTWRPPLKTRGWWRFACGIALFLGYASCTVYVKWRALSIP